MFQPSSGPVPNSRLNHRACSHLGNTLETKAAYWEPRIKTYGFQRMTGLSLVEMTVPRAGIESLGAAFCRLADAGVDFHLVFSRCYVFSLILLGVPAVTVSLLFRLALPTVTVSLLFHFSSLAAKVVEGESSF